MTTVAPRPVRALTGRQESLVAAATDSLSEERLRELVSRLIEAPSPTGGELPAAVAAADLLNAGGLDGRVQPFGGGGQANATARLPGTGSGQSLLLYAPLDTWTSGDPQEDLPWAASRWEDHLAATALDNGPYVTGLGAGNPKGHAACVIAATEAVARAVDRTGMRLAGDLLAGLGAGGMPTNGRPGLPAGTGHGAGVTHLLEQGGTTDAAVIAKPGWTASYEEVGLAWIEITVSGTHTYVGSRHRLPYRNAVADAARVVLAVEEWAPTYTARHTAGLVAPQVIVAAVDTGRTSQLAGTPAGVRVLLDVRLAPGTPAPQAVREVGELVAGLDVDAEVRLIVSVPGSHTDPSSPVVTAAREAITSEQGSAYTEITGTSGATDANLLRMRGIPTVRVGMPKVDDPAVNHDFGSGMNAVDVRELARLTRVLVQIAVVICS